LSAPPIPAECDLQDFPFMPLHVARLRDSDLAATAAPEACWYAVLLWAAAWHQIPAGSLPDDDAVLTRLIGLGRDVRTFRKHKTDALRGFVRHDDGRLYHPVVTEQVLVAWDSKRRQRWRAECARIKKQNQRRGTDDPLPTFEEFIGACPQDVPDPCPEFVPGDNGECPPGQSLQETGTGTETGILVTDDDARGRFSDLDRKAIAALEGQLREAAGAALNAASPRLAVVSPILALLRPGEGPAADLDMDVLPAIRAAAARVRRPVGRWDYFVPMIAEARDRRLAGAPAVGDVSAQRATGPPMSFADRDAAIIAEARRRVLQDGKYD
jgi:hypothetical protein